MNLADLISRDTTLRKVASTHGGEYAGPCPWCGGRDRFRVWPNADRPGYWCRQCGRTGDAIQYLRDRDRLSYRDACQHVGRPLDRPSRRTPRPITPPPSLKPPSPIWQAQARALVERCERNLWASIGEWARTYLHHRGFRDDILRQAHIGYQPCDLRAPAPAWGFPEPDKPVWIPRGIVLPFFGSGQLWKIWVRRPTGEPKYVALAGSRNALYGVDTLRPGQPAMLVEGGFDALAIR